VGLSRFDVVTPVGLAAEFGAAAASAEGRDTFMAALTLRVRSLERAVAAVQVPGVVRDDERILVPASEAFGVTLELRG